jgi:hypothetical protein
MNYHVVLDASLKLVGLAFKVIDLCRDGSGRHLLSPLTYALMPSLKISMPISIVSKNSSILTLSSLLLRVKSDICGLVLFKANILRKAQQSEESEINNFLHPVVLQVALDDDLDVAIVICRFYAIMDGRQPESHVVDAEESVARKLAVDYLDSGPFLLIASAVNDKEVSFPEDEFIESHEGSFVVLLRILLSAAGTPAQAHLAVKAGSVSLIHAAQLLTEVVVSDNLLQLAPHPVT